jgi:hypothetical protein
MVHAQEFRRDRVAALVFQEYEAALAQAPSPASLSDAPAPL